MNVRSLQVREHVAIALIGLINGLFLCKYGGHGSAMAIALGVGYAVILYCLAYYSDVIGRKRSAAWNRNALLLLLCAVLAAAVVIVHATSSTTRVGRMPAIVEWLDRIMDGRFPYHTVDEPSGFPVLFLLALPAYLVKNLGYVEVAGVILFVWLVMRSAGDEPGNAWRRSIMFALSPVIYYELLTRSELFFNMILVVAVLTLLHTRFRSEKVDWHFFGSALLLGLLLSTRSIVGIAYAVYVAYKFNGRILSGALFSMVIVVTFIATLVPFILWDRDNFFAGGPFSMQLRYMPLWVMVVVVILGGVFGWRARGMREVMFIVGVLTVGVVSYAFFGAIQEEGFLGVMERSRFDISYFILGVPFLLMSLGRNS